MTYVGYIAAVTEKSFVNPNTFIAVLPLLCGAFHLYVEKANLTGRFAVSFGTNYKTSAHAH